jgi:hypothetical protein
LRIDIVDLDTSHPQNWIPLERELGHEVVGVWDGGTVHPPEYVTQFAADPLMRYPHARYTPGRRMICKRGIIV